MRSDKNKVYNPPVPHWDNEIPQVLIFQINGAVNNEHVIEPIRRSIKLNVEMRNP